MTSRRSHAAQLEKATANDPLNPMSPVKPKPKPRTKVPPTCEPDVNVRSCLESVCNILYFYRSNYSWSLQGSGDLHRAPPPAYQTAVQDSRYGFWLPELEKQNVEDATHFDDHTVPPSCITSIVHRSYGGSAVPTSRGGPVAPLFCASSVAHMSRGGSITPVSHRGSVTPVSHGGIVAPMSRGGSVAPTSCRGSVVPTSHGGSVMPMSHGGSVAPMSCGGSVAPTSRRGSVVPMSHRGSVVPTPCRGSTIPRGDSSVSFDGSAPPSSCGESVPTPSQHINWGGPWFTECIINRD